MGSRFPTTSYLLAGLGIGLITGAGSMLYCFGLNYLPVSLVVTLSNLYIVITIVLGIVVLHEPVTALKIAGLTCIVAGVLILGALTCPLCGASRGQLSQCAAASPRVCDHGHLHRHDRGRRVP